MLVRSDILQPWKGEALGVPPDAIRYPFNIEQLWPVADLNAIGLYPAVRFVVPKGKRIVSGPTYRIEGQSAIEEYVTEDIPPPTPEELAEILEASVPPLGDAALQGLLDHENRLRVLEGAPVVEATEFRGKLKGLIRGHVK